jgi:hypothetical protein
MADSFNPFGTEAAEAQRQQSPLARVLALGRFALFAVLFFVILKMIERLGTGFGTGLHRLYWSALFGNLEVAIATLAATFILARMGGRRFGYYGLGKSPCGIRFGLGSACGFAALTLLLSVMRLLGVFYFGPAMQQGSALAGFALVYAALFFVVALSEETLFRGFALVSLTEAITFWPAALVLAFIFGWVHAGHQEESRAGLAFAGLFGVVLAYSFKRTGSLWFAIGLHAAWDFAESFVYGVPDSGVVVPGSWRSPVFHGPAWLTGAAAGPEGSYLMIFVLIGLAIAVRALFPAERSPS